MSTQWRRKRTEAGYAAILVSILLPVVFLGLSAIGVDVARWYVEVERTQKAADAAALGGVPYMPHDFVNAEDIAEDISARNGFEESSTVDVEVEPGSRPSELRVTISSEVGNTFGRAIGLPSTVITRTAVADYTGPAPMGSPCNTFGNEPPSQNAAASPIGNNESALPAIPVNPFCTSRPYFWAAIEGPDTDKVQGDRYGTEDCGTSNVTSLSRTVYGCDGNENEEYKEEGYFFVLKVEKEAVGKQIEIQLYDPAFVYTKVDCSALPGRSSFDDNMNSFVTTDGKNRYGDYSDNRYCSGDYFPGQSGTNHTPPTTTFVVREQTDSYDPLKAPVISGCVKQYKGTSSAPTVAKLKGHGHGHQNSYDPGLGMLFHNWVELCKFNPPRVGDYYIQVRTNVSAGGTEVSNTNGRVWENNPNAYAEDGNTSQGEGLNAFALRAVANGDEIASHVSLSGYDRMPILQNNPNSTATFNLIRALPGAAGQFISFEFFDPGDGAGSHDHATVKVLPPTDATGSITNTSTLQGCKFARNYGTFANANNCTVSVNNSSHDGQVVNMTIPVPSDYNCGDGENTTLGHCWFRVEIDFPSTVTDFTTWDGSIGGDPVRLVE